MNTTTSRPHAPKRGGITTTHAPSRQPRAMSDEHKRALTAGRNQSRAVRAYLEGLRANRPKRGRKRTADAIAKRLQAVEELLKTADPLQEVLLIQEQTDLTKELAAIQADDGLNELEQAFIEAAAPYARSKGIEYKTWRQAGVSADVLAKAGITR